MVDVSGATPANWETIPTKARLLNLRTGEFVTFIYNPDHLRITDQIQWAEIEIPGSERPYYQFVSGGELTIPLSIFLNEFKEGKRYREGYVENFIKFLRDAKTPKQVSYGGRIIRTAPDILRFFWGQITFDDVAPGVNTIISSLEIDRTMFRGSDGQAVRAVVDLELKKWQEI